MLGLLTRARGAVGEAHEGEQLVGPAACLAPAGACYQGGNHHVLPRRELGQQLVELEDEAYLGVPHLGQLPGLEVGDVAAVNKHLAGGGPVEQPHYLQQRRLARAAGTYDADDLAFLYGQADALEHLQVAEAFCDVCDGNHYGVRS